MFETIAMICYLSLVEPQIAETPDFQDVLIMENFTGAGEDPEDNPKKTGNN